MSVVSRHLIGCRRLRLAAGIALALSVLLAGGSASAQATDQSTAGTQEANPAPTTNIFPSATATSQTCLFGCSTQLQSCQNTCISTITGTTVVPSMTTVGTTSSPQACQSNCSSQQLQCSRNCTNLGP